VHQKLAKAQSQLVYGFLGASVTDGWRRALEIVQTILSGQSGRLFLELRDRRSMAYSVSAVAVEGVDPGYFAVYMATSPEKVPAALDGMKVELRRLVDELVPEDELERAKEHLIGTHDIGLQRNSARAGVIALNTCYGLGALHHERYAEELAAISAHDVREAARRVIDFERGVLAVVGP
jgi:zinc protease